MPYFSFLFICLTWGASFILMDRASLALGPLAIGIGRMLCGAAVLAAYCVATRQWVKLRPGDLRNIVVVGALSNAYPFVVQPYVMRNTGEHGYFGLLVALVPLLTILLAAPLLGQRATARQWCGVLGGLAFTGLIVAEGRQRGFGAHNLALALTVPLSYAMGNIYIKWKLDHLKAAPLTTMFLAAGGVLLLPLAAWPQLVSALGLHGPPAPREWALAIGALALLSVVGTGVAILLFIDLIKTQGPLFAGMVTYVVPMFALVWGQVDSEPLTGGQLAAVAGVLAMVALVQVGAAVSPAPATSDQR
ncbi:MAG: DMT family transporter [Planctomycetota bacterium]